MKDRHLSSSSEASTEDDEVSSWGIGGSLCEYSEDDNILPDVSEGDDQSLEIPPRGWSMKHGHMKKLAKHKRKKTDLWAEIQGQAKEVSRGRAVFARSVNDHHKTRWYCRHDCDPKSFKAVKRHTWQDLIRHDSLEYAEEPCSWEDSAYEEEWDWSPVDSYGCIEEESYVTGKPVQTIVDKKNASVDLDKLACRLKSHGAILEKESFGKGRFDELQKQILQEHGPSFCSELAKSVSRTIHVMPAPVSTDVKTRFLEARRTLSGALRPGYHGTDASALPSIYKKGLLIPGQDNGICVANGSAHGLGVYTAKVNAPALSWNFCRAPTPMQRRMVVCGILDDAPQSRGCRSYTMGIRTVSHESQNVRHVGDAMVIFDDRRVAPFFEVTIGEELDTTQIGAQIQAFDWVHWRQTVDRVLSTFPAKTKRVRARPLPIAFVKLQRLKQKTAIAYLTRRSASKRNPKIL